MWCFQFKNIQYCVKASPSERAYIGIDPKKACSFKDPDKVKYMHGHCSQSDNSHGIRYCWIGGGIAVP